MQGASFAIGERVFEPRLGLIRAPDGTKTVLRPKTAQVLAFLAARGGELVSRDELIEAVWPGVYVTENGLTQCVAEIRSGLGQQATVLRTLPRRGYILDAAPLGAPPAQPVTDLRPAGLPVIAMMPLRLPAGSDGDVQAFADILHDSVVGTLALMREPIVISASSTRHLAGAPDDIPQLARRVGAGYLVCGDLRRVSGRVRLAVELADATQGAVVWHRTYDIPDEDLFKASEELARTIAHTFVPRLRDAELRAALSGRRNVGAYHLMLDGRRQMARLERTSFESAGDILRRAAALDPGFAGPHAALADWHSLRIGQRWSDDPAAEARALENEVRIALELDGGHARALAVLGHNCTILHHDYDRAQDLLNRALTFAPNDAETCLWVSPTLAYTGQSQEAVRMAEHALRLSPEDPLIFRHQHFLSIAHYANHCWEEAAHWGLQSLRSNSDYTSNLALTAGALAALGRSEEARPAAARLMALRPDFRVSKAQPRWAYQDHSMREQYGEHLIAAGLPA